MGSQTRLFLAWFLLFLPSNEAHCNMRPECEFHLKDLGTHKASTEHFRTCYTGLDCLASFEDLTEGSTGLSAPRAWLFPSTSQTRSPIILP